jgi:uncharacterized paraquat-inducible protein A
MQCETCGYELFNLTVPRCPECNTPIAVVHTMTPAQISRAYAVSGLIAMLFSVPLGVLVWAVFH